MTETDAMAELSSVLDRLNGRLDAMEKGELPAGLKEHMEDKKDDKDEKDEKDEAKDMADKDKDEKMYGADHKGMHGEMAKGEEYSDVISSEYLNWMESTLKGQGVDIGGARAHFDGISKANLGSTPEAIGDGADYFAGQVKGRAQEGGSPSTNAIGKINSSGGGTVAKGYLHPSAVSPTDVEAAYEVYKAAALEEQFKHNLSGVFADRLNKELTEEAQAREAASFDARTPLANIEKALSDLSDRIDNISSAAPETTIRKSSDVSNVEIPSTEALGSMSWDEVHQLAGSVFTN